MRPRGRLRSFRREQAFERMPEWQAADKLVRDGHQAAYEKEARYLYGLDPLWYTPDS